MHYYNSKPEQYRRDCAALPALLPRGWVCLANLHFSDGEGVKLRPVMVLWCDRHGEDVIVLPLSRTPLPPNNCVKLDPYKPEDGVPFLHYESYIHCTRPTTLARSKITGKLGELRSEKVEEARAKLARQLGLVIVSAETAA